MSDSRNAPVEGAPNLHASKWCCIKLHERSAMDAPNFFNDLQSKINQVLENSPAKDIEKNVKALLNQGFSKLDLVTREEFDVQTQVLAKTRAKLEVLEARIAELEAQLKD
jgi:BMFP domain-containing protein YqiC